MQVRVAACLLIFVGSLRAEPARAEPPAAEPIRSSYWRAIVAPEQARADQLVRHGRALLYPAVGLGMLLGTQVAVQRRIAVENALARFERAVELAPDNREARLFYSKALAFWEPEGDDDAVRSRDGEAIAQLLALRTLDPLYEAQEVAFQLGVLYTRTGDFTAATAEYEHSLALNSDGEDNGTLLGNLAEVTMLRGDVARALALYERAAREGESRGRTLALWGMAIALDRLGERTAALEQARRAIVEDHAPLAVLRQTGVFFVPPQERYYYEALGALALADAEREPGQSLAGLSAQGVTWLSEPESEATLLPFERALAELNGTEHARALAPLRTRVTHTLHALRRQAQASGPNGPQQNAKDGARASEALPQARGAIALLWQLRSLSGFATYLRLGGEDGPFAQDARDHVNELRRSLNLH